VPANAVVAGIPARVIRMRETPRELRWTPAVEPDPEAHTTLSLPPSS
jgi:serine acetyltransferase